MHQKNKSLVIILALLCCVAIALATVVIINHLKNSEPATTEEPTSQSSNLSEEEQARLNSYNKYNEDYKNANDQATAILNQEPIDVAAINSIYSTYIQSYTSEGEFDRAAAFIRAERDLLLSKNLEQDTLDFLTTIDYSVFIEPEQHRFYLSIIDLANKLNRTDVLEKYEPLAANTKAAYDANNAASEKAAAEGEAAKQRGANKTEETE